MGAITEFNAGLSNRSRIIVAVVVLACVGGLAVFVRVTGGGTDTRAGGDESQAFDVCTQFVKDRLRAPATAEFPNQFEDDGEVTITHTGETYTVISQVDSENVFGALLTTPFTCVVRHTSGENWRLVDLNMVG